MAWNFNNKFLSYKKLLNEWKLTNEIPKDSNN